MFINYEYTVLTTIKLERYLSYCILCFVVTHTIVVVVVVVVVVENELDRVIVGPDRAIVGISLGSETGSVVQNKILEYHMKQNASHLAGCMITFLSQYLYTQCKI